MTSAGAAKRAWPPNTTISPATVPAPRARSGRPSGSAARSARRTTSGSSTAMTAARGQAQNVGGARVAAVARTLGAAYRQPAAAAFEHGYRLAVGAGAGCLLLGALIAVAGFRGQQAMPAAPPSREQQPERAR